MTSILRKSSGKLANVKVQHLNDNKVLCFMLAGWTQGLEPLCIPSAFYSTDTQQNNAARHLLCAAVSSLFNDSILPHPTTEGCRAQLGIRAGAGNYLLSETAEKQESTF